MPSQENQNQIGEMFKLPVPKRKQQGRSRPAVAGFDPAAALKEQVSGTTPGPSAEPAPEPAETKPEQPKSEQAGQVETEKVKPIRMTTTVPEDVWLQVDDYCRRTGQTRTGLIMFALGSTAERHRELVLAERGQGLPTELDAKVLSMFDLQEAPTPRGRAVAKKQLQLYPPAHVAAKLDELVQEAGAAHRSELIGAALRAYLGDQSS